MAVGPNDYWGELNPEPEAEDWVLPEPDQEWLELWWNITYPVPTYCFASRHWDDNRFAMAA